MFQSLSQIENDKPRKMELKEFITAALVDIVNAVKDAQCVVGTDATIMPYGCKGGGVGQKVFIAEPTAIEFDVAVSSSAQENNSAKGNVGISVASVLGVGVGTKTENQTGLSHLSRIKFTLSVTLPHNHYPNR